MISFSLDLHVELHVAGGANASRVAPRASVVPLYPERIQRSGPRLAQLAAGSNVCFNMKSTQISRAPTDVRDGRSHELCMPLDPFVLTFCIVGRRPRCTSPDARPSAVFWNYCTRPAKSRYENSIEVHGVNARNRWQDPSPASMPCDEKYDSDAPASCARAHI